MTNDELAKELRRVLDAYDGEGIAEVYRTQTNRQEVMQ